MPVCPTACHAAAALPSAANQAERLENLSSLFLLEGRRGQREAADLPQARASHQQKACLDMECWAPSGLGEDE